MRTCGKLGLATLLLAAAATAAAQQPELLDRIAIIADDDIILESEIRDAQRGFREQIRQRGAQPPPEEELLRQVIQYLVTETLQLQMAERAGIFVEDEQVRQALEATASNEGMDVEAFLRDVEAKGGSPSRVRESLTKRLRINEMQAARLRPQVRLTEKEVETFLNSEEGQSLFADEFLVQHILLPTSDGAAKARRLAMDLRKRAEEGESFSEMAVRYSAARTALEGGDLGWRKLGELPRRFSPVVRKMQRGDVSAPIEDERAIHLVRLADRRGDTTEYVRRYRLRHIMLRPNTIRDSEQTRHELDGIRDAVLEGDSFSNLAKLHSEDPTSALLGGELEAVTLAELPPAFAEVAEGLDVGTLSEPFETDSGWHIAELLESHLEDTTEAKMRQRAQQVLYQRKYEEELERFLASLLEDAYLEYKEPWLKYKPG